jgi:hypothetical protein
MAHKPLFEVSEIGTMHPLLSILPNFGSVSKLRALTSSLFARHQRILQMISQLELMEGAAETRRRYLSEEIMLRQALEWLGAEVEEL